MMMMVVNDVMMMVMMVYDAGLRDRRREGERGNEERRGEKFLQHWVISCG